MAEREREKRESVSERERETGERKSAHSGQRLHKRAGVGPAQWPQSDSWTLSQLPACLPSL